VKPIRWLYPLLILPLLAGAFLVAVPAGRAQDQQTETPVPTLSPTDAPVTTLDDYSAVPVIDPEQQADLFGAGGGGGCLLFFINGSQVSPIPQLDYEADPDFDCVEGLPKNTSVTATILEPDGTVYAQKSADSGDNGSISLFLPNALSLPAGTWTVHFQSGTPSAKQTLVASYTLALPTSPSMAVRCDGTKPVVILLNYTPSEVVSLALVSVGFSNDPNHPISVHISVKYLWRLQIGSSGKLVAYPHLAADPTASLSAGQTLYIAQTDAQGKIASQTSLAAIGRPYPNCAFAAAFTDFDKLSAQRCWPAISHSAALHMGMAISLPEGHKPIELFSAPSSVDNVPLPGGHSLSIVGGPYTCGNRAVWWQIRTENGNVGWAVEPDAASPDFETASVDLYCPGFSPASRLWIGIQARVTPGTPNKLNSKPERPALHADSQTIANIPAGAIFRVIGGPVCADGILWWQVNYNGVTGWTGEGQGSDYWVEPVN